MHCDLSSPCHAPLPPHALLITLYRLHCRGKVVLMAQAWKVVRGEQAG